MNIPAPHENERPVDYAFRVAHWYITWCKPDKKLGQFFTPPAVARFMAKQLPISASAIHALDPGAGTGILSCALCEHGQGDVVLEAYEVDKTTAILLQHCLHYAQRWMHTRGYHLDYTVHQDDFVLAHANALYRGSQRKFDVVICNPPYLKLPKSDQRAKAAARVVHGQPNLYALFMAVSSALLNTDGRGIYITPRSYTTGVYFQRFREYFFTHMSPSAIHLFHSRRDVFETVLQESMILVAQRSTHRQDVIVSSSENSAFAQFTARTVPSENVLNEALELSLPMSEAEDGIAARVQSWTGSLHQYGMEVSTGPVVPFRANHLIKQDGSIPATHAPLIWMQHVKPMHFLWPHATKSQYLQLEGAGKLLIPNQNYVLLRRFSTKEEAQRLVAAPYLSQLDTPCIGVENHLNYIYRPQGSLSISEARGLAILLNSKAMNSYFCVSNGNTQVSATELRKLPLPPLSQLCELGNAPAERQIDELVSEVLDFHA